MNYIERQFSHLCEVVGEEILNPLDMEYLTNYGDMLCNVKATEMSREEISKVVADYLSGTVSDIPEILTEEFIAWRLKDQLTRAIICNEGMWNQTQFIERLFADEDPGFFLMEQNGYIALQTAIRRNDQDHEKDFEIVEFIRDNKVSADVTQLDLDGFMQFCSLYDLLLGVDREIIPKKNDSGKYDFVQCLHLSDSDVFQSNLSEAIKRFTVDELEVTPKSVGKFVYGNPFS